MLGKMLAHGLVAGMIVGGIAAAYSPTATTEAPRVAETAATGPVTIAMMTGTDRPVPSEARRARHDRKFRHDDDD